MTQSLVGFHPMPTTVKPRRHYLAKLLAKMPSGSTVEMILDIAVVKSNATESAERIAFGMLEWVDSQETTFQLTYRRQHSSLPSAE